MDHFPLYLWHEKHPKQVCKSAQQFTLLAKQGWKKNPIEIKGFLDEMEPLKAVFEDKNGFLPDRAQFVQFAGEFIEAQVKIMNQSLQIPTMTRAKVVEFADRYFGKKLVKSKRVAELRAEALALVGMVA